MTRKDYVAIARAIADARAYGRGLTRRDDMIHASTFVDALCGILREDNPRFDSARFRDACALRETA